MVNLTAYRSRMGMTYIAEAIERHRFSRSRLASLLGITPDGVTKQMDHERLEDKGARKTTLIAYASAMNTILAEGNDPRRFTVESLQAGPDPVLPPAPTGPTFFPNSTPTGRLQSSGALDELDRRRLPYSYGGQAAEPEPLAIIPPELVRMRYYGEVPCGTPLDLGERRMAFRYEHREALRGMGWRDESCYVLQARGPSMTGFDIHDGDFLVVDSDGEARSTSIVVAQINGGTACRRLKLREDGRWDLQPGHADYDTITVSSRDELVIRGVVLATLPKAKLLR